MLENLTSCVFGFQIWANANGLCFAITKVEGCYELVPRPFCHKQHYFRRCFRDGHCSVTLRIDIPTKRTIRNKNPTAIPKFRKKCWIIYRIRAVPFNRVKCFVKQQTILHVPKRVFLSDREETILEEEQNSTKLSFCEGHFCAGPSGPNKSCQMFLSDITILITSVRMSYAEAHKENVWQEQKCNNLQRLSVCLKLPTCFECHFVTHSLTYLSLPCSSRTGLLWCVQRSAVEGRRMKWRAERAESSSWWSAAERKKRWV